MAQTNFAAQAESPKNVSDPRLGCSITRKLNLSILRRGCCSVVVNLRIFGIFCFEVRQNLVVTVMKKNDSIEASIQVWHIGFVSSSSTTLPKD